MFYHDYSETLVCIGYNVGGGYHKLLVVWAVRLWRAAHTDSKNTFCVIWALARPNDTKCVFKGEGGCAAKSWDAVFWQVVL